MTTPFAQFKTDIIPNTPHPTVNLSLDLTEYLKAVDSKDPVNIKSQYQALWEQVGEVEGPLLWERQILP